MTMYGGESKNVVRQKIGAFEDGVLCSRKSLAAEEFSYFSTLQCWSTMENRQFFLLEFKRSPEAWRLCLANDPTSAACRRCLEAVGHSTDSDTKAKVFLHPDHRSPVLDYLEKGAHSPCRPSDLQVRHVITDERHCKAVLSAVDGLRSKDNVRVKSKPSFCVDVPCKPAWVSLQPELPWQTMPQPPKACETMEFDFQAGSPAEIRWRQL